MKKHEKSTEQFIKLMENEELNGLMKESIALSFQVNPDKKTNPVSNLDELYDFLDWSVKCLPWNVLKDIDYSNLYLNINQSINYFWFIFGQKLPELEDKGYYLPTLEYHEPIASWIRDYCDSWGNFLSSKESWNDDYFKLQFSDDLFGMNNGWYSKENIWNSYNDFFSRHLISKDVRPIGDAELVSPADAAPEGYWRIDDNGYVQDDVRIKTHKVYQIDDILGKESKYRKTFYGGTLTHTFLNVNDYHRYHFPIDGTIIEMNKIKGVNAVGGHTSFDPTTKQYILNCSDTSWQIIETRDCVVLDTKFGKVAVLPIGMSQVCSCNFEDNIKIGNSYHKGDPLGYFLFGGSDIVMLFEKNVEFTPLFKNGQHLLMGENYASLKNK